MEKRNDSDFLPLVLTGVVMLIMGAAVVMYPGEPTEPNGRAQTSAASADSQPATPAAASYTPQAQSTSPQSTLSPAP